MVKRYLNRFGQAGTEKLLAANNEKPYLTLKINTLKVSSEEFRRLLHAVNLKYTPGKYLPEFFKFITLLILLHGNILLKDYFNIQDESAGIACRLLDPQPGMRVLDLCAAPGGKTMFIASLMQDKGELVALDRYESRLDIMKKNITQDEFQLY